MKAQFIDWIMVSLLNFYASKLWNLFDIDIAWNTCWNCFSLSYRTHRFLLGFLVCSQIGSWSFFETFYNFDEYVTLNSRISQENDCRLIFGLKKLNICMKNNVGKIWCEIFSDWWKWLVVSQFSEKIVHFKDSLKIMVSLIIGS